jgi:hypothetical protein
VQDNEEMQLKQRRVEEIPSELRQILEEKGP